MAMDPYGFRQRNYMAPQFGNTGAMGIQRPQMPFTGMEIQGPLGSSPMGGGDINLPEEEIDDPFQVTIPRRPTRPPQLGIQNFASQPAEQKPFTGMNVQGPMGSTPGQSNEPDATSARPEAEDNEFDIFEAMYNAPTPALEAYKRHIMSAPQRGDYQPNKFDRVAAALTGVSQSMRGGGAAGYAASRAMIDQPYQEALQNYQTQGQGLGQLAEIESADMKNKMGYAKTMMEQKRLNQKELREGIRDMALNKLTGAQTEDLIARMKLAGLEVVDNELTGEKGIINKGTGAWTSFGQFAQTPGQKADTEVNIHGRKQGIEHGYNVSMAGVNFDNTLRGKGVDFANDAALADLAGERAKQLELFKAPLEVSTAVDKARGTAPIEVDVANQKRLFAQEHPIQSQSTQGIQPYQTNKAYATAVGQVIMEFPGYRKFANKDTATQAQIDDPKGHADFMAKVNRAFGVIKDAAKPVSGGTPAAPAPIGGGGIGGGTSGTWNSRSSLDNKPTPAPSPLNPAPNEDSALRAQAVAAIRERAKVDPSIQEDESTITQVMDRLRGK